MRFVFDIHSSPIDYSICSCRKGSARYCIQFFPQRRKKIEYSRRCSNPSWIELHLERTFWLILTEQSSKNNWMRTQSSKANNVAARSVPEEFLPSHKFDAVGKKPAYWTVAKQNGAQLLVRLILAFECALLRIVHFSS